MKARKYTEEQIIAVLKEGEAGAKVARIIIGTDMPTQGADCNQYGDTNELDITCIMEKILEID